MEDKDDTTPETTSQEQPQEAQASGALEHTNHTYREHVTDRTGELLESAVEVAQSFPRVKSGQVQDPRDNTMALVYSNGDGVHAIDPGIFDKYRVFPLVRKGSARVSRLSSFLELIDRHKIDSFTSVFVDDYAHAPSMTAVIDYHSELIPTGDEGGGHHHVPQRGDHTIHYPLPLSEEWQAWMGSNKKAMGLSEFASFIEDRIGDIQDPGEAENLGTAAKKFISQIGGSVGSPTEMMNLSRGINVGTASKVVNAARVESGEVQIGLTTEHTDVTDTAGKQISVPSTFLIAIPVFANAEVAYRMIVRFRYRAGETVKFFYELWRPDKILTDAIDEAAEQVVDTTGVPVFFGKPEMAG